MPILVLVGSTTNRRETHMSKSQEVMETVAAKIIASIEDGIVKGEWQKSWAGGAIAMNAVTGNQYKGGNLIALWVLGEDYGSGFWATYKQWQSVGAQVRKGETGTRLVKWTPLPCKDHGLTEICSNCGKMTECSCGSRASIRAIAASASSSGFTSPRRTSSACAVASNKQNSSDMPAS